MSLRFSQIAVETLQRPTTANERISQLAVEIIQRPSAPKLRLSQIAVEIISRNGGGLSSASSAASGMLIIAT